MIDFRYLLIHKSIDSSIYKEKRFKGPKGTNPLLTSTVADYWGQIPWTHFGQGVDMEGRADKYDEQGLQGFVDL